jgi:hypothetical protein
MRYLSTTSHRPQATAHCSSRRGAARAGDDPTPKPGHRRAFLAAEYDRLRALNRVEFQRFYDRIAEHAVMRGMGEGKAVRNPC